MQQKIKQILQIPHGREPIRKRCQFVIIHRERLQGSGQWGLWEGGNIVGIQGPGEIGRCDWFVKSSEWKNSQWRENSQIRQGGKVAEF